jgi:hypothetical protein
MENRVADPMSVISPIQESRAADKVSRDFGTQWLTEKTTPRVCEQQPLKNHDPQQQQTNGSSTRSRSDASSPIRQSSGTTCVRMIRERRSNSVTNTTKKNTPAPRSSTAAATDIPSHHRQHYKEERAVHHAAAAGSGECHLCPNDTRAQIQLGPANGDDLATCLLEYAWRCTHVDA